MGFCKIDSDLWTFFLFYTHGIAFGVLCMMDKAIFDKTQHRLRKSIFYDQTTKKLSLKISELVQDKFKIFVGGENSTFHLSAEKNWTYLVTGCTRTDWLKLVSSIEKRLWEPLNEAKLFLYFSW